MDNDQFHILLARLNKQDDKLDAIHGDFREHKGAVDVKIQNLQDEVKSNRLWHHIQTVGVIPVIGILRQIFKHYGL